jgi:rare lipoprotein A
MWRRLAVVMVLGGTGCALLHPTPPTPPVIDGVQVGVASWYGPGFHGKRTASGERYDQWAFTAAHQTLPLGTPVMVTSLENGRAVQVRINDRGPFVDGRVIDLSRAAAESLHMIGPGLMRVRVRVLGTTRSAPPLRAARDGPVYVVQIGAFSRRRAADALRDGLASRFSDVHVSPCVTPSDRRFRVRVGPFDTREAAVHRASQVTRLGYAPIIMQTTTP